jgi:hypothetical protein
MVRRLALWLLYQLPACSVSILWLLGLWVWCVLYTWSFYCITPWGWPERAETCRSVEICNKYTKSAFVGSCYSHSYEDARKTLNKILTLRLPAKSLQYLKFHNEEKRVPGNRSTSLRITASLVCVFLALVCFVPWIFTSKYWYFWEYVQRCIC